MEATTAPPAPSSLIATIDALTPALAIVTLATAVIGAGTTAETIDTAQIAGKVHGIDPIEIARAIVTTDASVTGSQRTAARTQDLRSVAAAPEGEMAARATRSNVKATRLTQSVYELR